MVELNENKLIGSFVDFYKKKAEETKFQMGFNFNVLAEQCRNIVENSHTNMLMRLLEYRNRYGYVFLEDFISMAGFDIKIEKGDVYFKRESPTVSEAGKNGRIDGFIYQKTNFAIIIENKINHAGNQEQQIERYIDDIIKKQIVPDNCIYVVFLTRDGVESPDKDSIRKMKDMGICDEGDDEQITGPRYFPCSYSQHILNWLKDNIHPMVPQKDIVLNAGIIQYIDYLEGLLGCSPNLLRFNNEFKKWFEENITLPDDPIAKNASLYKLYDSLSEQDNDDTSKSEAINVMKNLIEAKNDELMDTFLSVTKDFFTSGLKPLMEEYHMNHHFTYYYITIRDKKWPRGIDFGWYPLGLKKLSKSNELTFSFKAYGKKLSDSVELELKKKGFVYSTKSKSYRKTIDIGNGTFFDMNEEQQKTFLEEVYRTSAVPIIKDIIPKI
jgi:hypothetical protein